MFNLMEASGDLGRQLTYVKLSLPEPDLQLKSSKFENNGKIERLNLKIF